MPSAPRRGEAVRSYSTISFPVKKPGPVHSNARHALEHDKFIVADDTDVQAGRPQPRVLGCTAQRRELVGCVQCAGACRVAWRQQWIEGIEPPPAS